MGAANLPRKTPTVIGSGLPAKVTKAAPARPMPKGNGKAWSPRADVAAGKSVAKGPIRHVESPPIRNGIVKDFWHGTSQPGDMVIAMENMSVYVLGPLEQTPVHPYLVPEWSGASNAAYFGGNMNDGAVAQPVMKGTIGIFAGTVRILERGKNGNVAILRHRHTVIFPSGRYVVSDLNLVHPAL